MSTQAFGSAAASSDLTFIEKGVYSVASAAISGVSSLVNSTASLTGGIFSESTDPLINKAEAVEGLLGAEGRAYYEQNQLGLDTFGEIAAAFIPGTLAVKGLRLAQGSKFAMTGWREAQAALAGAPSGGISFGTILRPVTAADDLVKAARLSMAAGEEAILFKPLINKAIGSFGYQGALEGAAFEYAAQLFLKEGTLYDKASTTDTLLWNPLIAASLGGAFGAASGIFKVYGAGIREDIKGLSFGTSLKPFYGDAAGISKSIGELPAETLGFMALRNNDLKEVVIDRLTKTTDTQGKSILTANLQKLEAESQRAFERQALQVVSGDLEGQIIVDLQKNMDVKDFAATMTAVKSVARVGGDGLAENISSSTLTLMRATDDSLHLVSSGSKLPEGKIAKQAVSINDSTLILESGSARALSLIESKAAKFIQREADGSFTAPNGIDMSISSGKGWSKELAAGASEQEILGAVKAARQDLTAKVIIDAKTGGAIQTGTLHLNVADLISPAAAKKAPQLVKFRNADSGEILERKIDLNFKNRIPSSENSFEAMSKKLDKFDEIDFQQAWMAEADRARDAVKADKALSKEAFDSDLFQAASHVDALEAAGKTEFRLQIDKGIFTDPISINEARIQIAERKLAEFERLRFLGLAPEQIEQRLKAELTEGIVPTIEGMIGSRIDFAKPRYLALETNVYKAGLFREAASASAAYQIERQQWRSQYSVRANEIISGLGFGAFPDLDYRNFKTAVNAATPAPTLFTNAIATPQVLAAGAFKQNFDRKMIELGDQISAAQVATRNKITTQEAINELAAIELKFHSTPAWDVPIIKANANGNFYLVPRKLGAELDSLADQAMKNANKPDKVAMFQDAQERMIKQSGTLIKNKEVAEHLLSLAKAKNSVRDLRDPFQALHGKDAVANIPNELFFPPIDALEVPFVLFKRIPGMAGQPSKMEASVARNAEEFQAMKTRMEAQIRDLDDGFVGATLHTTDDIKRNKQLQLDYDFNKDFLNTNFSSEAQRKGVVLGAPSQGLAGRASAERIDSWIHSQYRLAADELTFAAWPQVNELQMLHADWVKQNVQSTFGKGTAKNSQFDIDRVTIAEKTSPFSLTLDLLMNKSREDRTKIPGVINRSVQAAYDKGMEWITNRTATALSDPKLVKNILTDQELIALSKEAQYYGVNSDFLQTGVAHLKTQGVVTPDLMNGVHKLNALSQFLTLRMDAMNPLVNLLSTPITGIPHIRNLVNEARLANGGKLPERLQELLGVKGEDGNVSTLSLLKVFFKAAREFHGEKGLAQQVLQTIGKDGRNLQHRQNLIDIRSGIFIPQADRTTVDKALTGVADYFQKNKIASTLGNWSDHAEELTQFLAARSGQLIAEASGLSKADTRLFMAGFAEQVNNSTNRAARHSFYNGPVGAVLGLYQNYMRGMMTRTLQFLQEGNPKAILEMAGLQATLFGARSLPLMDFYNRNLLGENNAAHADAFTAIYGVNGKALGDFITYGAGSSLLGVNVFSRGDLTPFSPTVLPLPWDSAPAKTLINIGKLGGEIMESMGSLLKGDASFAKNNFLYALEHNGLNRPIGRTAAMFQGYSTTINGQPVYKFGQAEDRGIWGGILPSQVAWPLTIAAGLAGTSGLTEAVNKDVLYRFTAYQLEDKKARNEFSKNMRIEAGLGTLNEERVSELSARYVEKGGSPTGFKTALTRAYSSNQSDNMTELFKAPSMQKSLRSAQVILGPNATLNPDPNALSE